MISADGIRPIDQSRASRLALAALDNRPEIANEAMDEAHGEHAFPRLIAALVRTWLLVSLHYAGEQRTREALQAAIWDAELASDAAVAADDA